MRVVVTGGTGFVGKALVASLVERGDDVVVFTRGPSNAPVPPSGTRPGSVSYVGWTPDREGPWMEQLDGASAVVHLAGAGVFDERWSEARKQVLRDSRILSTDLLARGMAKAARKPRVFVSTSAVGIYGTKTGDALLEDDAPHGDDFLARLVHDWEAAAEPARDAGVRVCHPRTGLVLGQGGGMLEKMLPPFKAFVGGPVGSGKQWLPWVHLRDVVRAMEYAIATPSLAGAFNLMAPEPVTMNDFADALGKALGRPSKMRVPAFAVKMAFGEAAEVVLTGQRAVPTALVRSGFAFVFPDLASALADLVAP